MIVDTKKFENVKSFDSFKLALLIWYTDQLGRCCDDGQRSAVKDELEYIVKTFNALAETKTVWNYNSK